MAAVSNKQPFYQQGLKAMMLIQQPFSFLVAPSSKRQRLEATGWTIGTVEGFLGLLPEETVFIEMKLTLIPLLSLRGDQKAFALRCLDFSHSQ